MRALLQRPLGIFVLALVAVFALPAMARADSDVVKTINGAEVRIRVVGGKTYIAVRSGTLTLKYPNGTVMASVPAGTSLMLDCSVTGMDAAGATGLTVTPTATDEASEGSSYFNIALSDKSPALQINMPDGKSSTVQKGRGLTVTTSTTFLTEIIRPANAGRFGRPVIALPVWVASSSGEDSGVSGADRAQLSAIN